MKVTDSEVIKAGEQELIDGITADLDWGVIEDIFLKEHNMGITEDIEYKNGDIIAHDNQIAYKLEFEVKASLAILLDREGNYISVSVSGADDSANMDTDEKSTHHLNDSKELDSDALTDSENVKTDDDPVHVPSENNLSTGEHVSEDNYENALKEVSEAVTTLENGLDTSISSEKEAENKISQLADQVGEIIEQ